MGDKKKTAPAKKAAPAKDAEKAAEPKKTNSGARGLRTLELRFQPVFDVHLNMSIDFLVNLRINDRQMGVLLQDTIFPIAEKSNQICELNKWTVEEGCDAILRCAKREADINRLIVPISKKYLSKPYCFKQLTKIVESKGVEPDKFCFNISESIYEAEQKQVSETIKQLREYGFLVSIDDFGMEYSSVSHLGMYEVDYIGIHASLLDDIMTEEKVQNRLQGIIEFCKKVEAQTRIDGIDTPEKEALVRSLGADQMLGELYGKPCAERAIKL